MANPEHVEIVRKGKAAIDGWRTSHPGDSLDLIRAELFAADLKGVDLNSANLSSANLESADLEGANLANCLLNGANLNLARLTGSELGFADCFGTQLRRADLSGAKLFFTKFMATKFHETDFRNAFLGGTAFAGVDLSGVRSLDSVKFTGPCSIGLDTLYVSKGKIPDSFLRGCGVPDDLITYLPSLLGAGVDFYSAFISYSHADEEFAKRLHARMQQEHLRVWFAPEDMQAGRKFHEQIFDAIRVHDKLLLVLSPESIRSDWVMAEVQRARRREAEDDRQVLFPIRLCDMAAIETWKRVDVDSGKDLAAEVREYHIPDFSNWKDHDAFERAFARLLRDLKPEPPPPAFSGRMPV